MKIIYSIFTALAILAFLSCQTKTDQQAIPEEKSLEFELVKTLEYEYLGRAFMLDYSNEMGVTALYDDQRDEIIIANDTEILVQKKLSGDSKNSYGGRFAGGLFWKDKLIIFGMGSAYFIYDLDLNLIERVDLPHPSANSIGGPFTYNYIFNDWLVYYADTKEDRASMDPPADPVVIWNLAEKSTRATVKTPNGIPQVWNPGGLGMSPAKFAHSNDRLLVIYPYHPVIYQVDMQNVRFVDSTRVEIKNWQMPEVIKRDFDNRIEAIFDDLTYPSFTFLYASEDLLIASYENGIPKEEVDGLPRNMLGGQQWYDLEAKYRTPKMIAIDGNNTVVETDGERGIPKWCDGFKVELRPIGTAYKDVEEDFIRFYLYKPVLKAKTKINSDSTELNRVVND